MEGSEGGGVSLTRVIAAFAAVYVIWGSTYLAIRFAIETLPPFLMASARFLVAGALLYGWTRLKGASRPGRAHWMGALIVGGLLLLGGNGAVVWAEQRIPSGVAALVVAIVPLWMVVLDWLWGGSARPTGRVWTGLGLGLVGLALLIGPGALLGSGQVDGLGVLVVVLGSLAWTVGSLYSRRTRLPTRPLQATAMQMLCGGALLAILAGMTGEWSEVSLAAVSMRSGLALAYLIVFGSLVAFTAYVWLLRVSTPARVSTYAYVNPVVAVLLGWALASEPLTPRMLIASAVIVGAVAMITSDGMRRSAGSPQTKPPEGVARRAA